jgi:ribosomal protein S18 acetylase RimI-like enzyme
MYGIQALSKEEWQGYELVFRYESTHFYDAEIKQDSNGFYISFVRRPFLTAMTKEFTGELFADHWDNIQAFGIFHGSNLIACLEISHEEWSNRLRVTTIWVAEKFRRKGFGKNLLTLAKSKALELGCRALMLETQSCNDKAIAFYLSQGLTLFGFDRSCYSNSDIEKHEVRLELGMYLETPAE